VNSYKREFRFHAAWIIPYSASGCTFIEEFSQPANHNIMIQAFKLAYAVVSYKNDMLTEVKWSDGLSEGVLSLELGSPGSPFDSKFGQKRMPSSIPGAVKSVRLRQLTHGVSYLFYTACNVSREFPGDILWALLNQRLGSPIGNFFITLALVKAWKRSHFDRIMPCV